jgi:glycosyltransferase involved in cell wall biosynthesis
MNTVLHTEASPGLGGQEVRTLNEARWTAERGWRVLLACQPGGLLLERARAAGLETVPVRMRAPFDPRALAGLVRLIRRERVSLVHTHSSIDAWLGGLAARLCRVPVVRTRHVSIAIRKGLNPVYRWLADRVITSGEAIRRMVLDVGVPPERVVAIPAGVNLEAFRFGARAPETARELGLGCPVIGSVAMFRSSKDPAAPPGLRDGAREETRGLAPARGRRDPARVGGAARAGGQAGRTRSSSPGSAPDVPALLGTMDYFRPGLDAYGRRAQALLQAFARGVPVGGKPIAAFPR